jgi:hypothetical protein
VAVLGSVMHAERPGEVVRRILQELDRTAVAAAARDRNDG